MALLWAMFGKFHHKSPQCSAGGNINLMANTLPIIVLGSYDMGQEIAPARVSANPFSVENPLARGASHLDCGNLIHNPGNRLQYTVQRRWRQGLKRNAGRAPRNAIGKPIAQRINQHNFGNGQIVTRKLTVDEGVFFKTFSRVIDANDKIFVTAPKGKGSRFLSLRYWRKA